MTKYPSVWLALLALMFLMSYAAGAEAAVQRESIDCRSTSIYEPSDTNPYKQPVRQNAVSGGVTFSCITGHVDSFVTVNIKRLALSRAVLGGVYRQRCMTKTPGFVPMRRSGFFVIFSLNVRCPAVRVKRTYVWRTEISYTMRAEWRKARPVTRTDPSFNSYPVGLRLK